ncbi:hypothetical protein [Bordetella sp. LUAb4]|uniref:hypothetical protein n=1 Tax=Bordetella sp. LUAb4 TaxID=2843195 RepID=UPI001E5E8B87|nr:hypothetical protein [Bordetella sp. LUAb4]
MPFRPPLTSADLAKIRARYEASSDRAPCAYQDIVVWEDILALLHEIKRLRALALTAHQLRDSLKKPNSCLDGVWEDFRNALAMEPCVAELGDLKIELLGPGKRRANPKQT